MAPNVLITMLIKRLFLHDPCQILRKSFFADDNTYLKSTDKWWDGYKGERCIVLFVDSKQVIRKFKSMIRDICLWSDGTDGVNLIVQRRWGYVELNIIQFIIICSKSIKAISKKLDMFGKGKISWRFSEYEYEVISEYQLKCKTTKLIIPFSDLCILKNAKLDNEEENDSK